MSDSPLYLIYDPAFDDMDAEGCPGFGFILVFDEQDLDNYQSGENPPFPAVSMLFTDHADGSISGDLLGWAQLDAEIFQHFPRAFRAAFDNKAFVQLHQLSRARFTQQIITNSNAYCIKAMVMQTPVHQRRVHRNVTMV